ncbi:AAA family ATPase [Serinicoccus kebangsaanensis]|uniref:AAA family ATPase n=1 Tax=Serinicoccus kebangsaanensis TaxID=2602069 RepID=UPI00124E8548|nr:AAA family ATPase [Serinicoccus kebangsaanensis]
MSRILAAAVVNDQGLQSSLQSLLGEMPDTELLGIARTGRELGPLLDDPELDVVLLSSELREDYRSIVRDIQNARPFLAVLVIAPEPDAALLQSVMELGARGVISSPPSLSELQSRIENAATWSKSLRVYSGGEGREERGRVIALAGSKGGVGTSTLSVLLAEEVAKTGKTVCLVDGNFRRGSVPYFANVKPRRTFAEIADVAAELTGRTIREVVVDSPAGYSVLAGPTEVEKADDVTGAAARQVIQQLRYLYDVILIDLGTHVEDAQAAMVELADTAAIVVGADIASINAARSMLSDWERLGMRTRAEVDFVFNGADRRREVQPDMAGRLLGRPAAVTVPSGFAQLEAAHNIGDLSTVRDGSVRSSVRALAVSLGLSAERKEQGRRRHREAGQSAVELPIAVLVFLAVFFVGVQAILAATALAFTRHSANAGARELGVTDNTSVSAQAARDAMPDMFEHGFSFQPAGDSVTVRVTVPRVFPIGDPFTVSQSAAVQREPNS